MKEQLIVDKNIWRACVNDAHLLDVLRQNNIHKWSKWNKALKQWQDEQKEMDSLEAIANERRMEEARKELNVGHSSS